MQRTRWAADVYDYDQQRPTIPDIAALDVEAGRWIQCRCGPKRIMNWDAPFTTSAFARHCSLRGHLERCKLGVQAPLTEEPGRRLRLCPSGGEWQGDFAVAMMNAACADQELLAMLKQMVATDHGLERKTLQATATLVSQQQEEIERLQESNRKLYQHVGKLTAIVESLSTDSDKNRRKEVKSSTIQVQLQSNDWTDTIVQEIKCIDMFEDQYQLMEM